MGRLYFAIARKRMSPIALILVLTLAQVIIVQGGRVLLSLFALDMGADPAAVGVLSATFALSPTLLAWWLGQLSDRLGATRMLLFAVIGTTAALTLPLVFPGLPTLYFSSGLMGMAFTAALITLQLLVGRSGTAEDRPRNYSNFTMVVSVSILLGPMGAGFAIDHIGFRATCGTLAVLGIIPLALVIAFRGRIPAGGGERVARGRIVDILRDRALRRVLFASYFVELGLELFQFYWPVYGHALGFSASVIGVGLGMFAAGSFCVRLMVPRLLNRFGHERVLIATFVVSGAAFWLMPLFQNVFVLCAIAFVVGVGLGSGSPITTHLTYSTSPPGRSGEALGLRFATNHLARVVGPVVFGAIGSLVGLVPVFLIGGGLIALAGLIPKRREN